MTEWVLACLGRLRGLCVGLDRVEASKTNKYKNPRRELYLNVRDLQGLLFYELLQSLVRGIRPRRSKQDKENGARPDMSVLGRT